MRVECSLLRLDGVRMVLAAVFVFGVVSATAHAERTERLPVRVLQGKRVTVVPGTRIFSWATGRPLPVKAVPGFGGRFVDLPAEGQYTWVRSTMWKFKRGGFRFERGRLVASEAPPFPADPDDEDAEGR